MADKFWYIVVLDPASVIGQMYSGKEANNDGVTENNGCPILRCTDIDMAGPLLFVSRKPNKGPSRQDVYLPYSAIVAIYQAARSDEPLPFGFQLRDP